VAVEKSPGSQVIEAVIERAHDNAQKYKHNIAEKERHAEFLIQHREKADECREHFEQCIEWLDANEPTWRDTLSESELEVFDLQNNRFIARP
jgi:hypothetical protein